MKGAVLRVSHEVYKELCARRKPRNAKTRLWESWDSLQRRMLGLPTKKGERYECLEGFIVGDRFYATLKEARGGAVLEQVRHGLEKAPRPVPVREVI